MLSFTKNNPIPMPLLHGDGQGGRDGHTGRKEGHDHGPGHVLQEQNHARHHEQDHDGQGPCCHHVHTEEEKRAVINRLSRAAGHLEKVRRMVENDADCSDVLIQLSAVRSALTNTGKVILQNHIDHCIVEAVQQGDMETIEKLERAINIFVK